MRDELAPLSGQGNDFFGGWAATLVDALDTLWVMDMKTEFFEAAKAANAIDFSTSTDDTINIFETTIRYLGGFLSAYDLSGEISLLHKAYDVGEMLLVSFDTPNHMPITRWNWTKAATGTERQVAPEGMLVSELGSLSLEFTRLSQLTGDVRWYDAIARITEIFDAQQNLTKLPGMWPISINPRLMNMTQDTTFTLGGMSDSVYEYFPKAYTLMGGLLPIYRKLYEQAMTTAEQHLFFRPLTPSNEDILMSGDAVVNADNATEINLNPKTQHLGCFNGGMLALGGRLFKNEHHIDLARKITNGCVWAYKSGPHGIMPEIATFVPCSFNDICTWDRSRFEEAVAQHPTDTSKDAASIIAEMRLPEGYVDVPDARYILRPEAIESVFVLYRVTGDKKYLDDAWDMWLAIKNITETNIANAAIGNLLKDGPDGLPEKQDRMESFWMAETLKYFYLIFSEPTLISLDEYVLNTEAHVLRRPS